MAVLTAFSVAIAQGLFVHRVYVCESLHLSDAVQRLIFTRSERLQQSLDDYTGSSDRRRIRNDVGLLQYSPARKALHPAGDPLINRSREGHERHGTGHGLQLGTITRCAPTA